jgi:hypothetical protein
MITPSFIEHYNNWTAKVNAITGTDLNSVYDRYMTLYVIYNNLYTHVPPVLIQKGIPVPNQIYDNKKATEWVVKYLGATEILQNLHANGNDADVQVIINLIKEEVFYIKLNHGQRQRNEDLKILKNLRSNNEVQKANAILQVCYYVRCNIFHGSKDFQEYQRLLIEPLTNIMRTVIAQLYNSLFN